MERLAVHYLFTKVGLGFLKEWKTLGFSVRFIIIHTTIVSTMCISKEKTACDNFDLIAKVFEKKSEIAHGWGGRLNAS